MAFLVLSSPGQVASAVTTPPIVATLNGGNFVAMWGASALSYGGQMFNPNTSPVGTTFQLSPLYPSAQLTHFGVTGAANGGYFVDSTYLVINSRFPFYGFLGQSVRCNRHTTARAQLEGRSL
jgi:hypothetical protein